jgi:hypothetical protein
MRFDPTQQIDTIRVTLKSGVATGSCFLVQDEDSSAMVPGSVALPRNEVVQFCPQSGSFPPGRAYKVTLLRKAEPFGGLLSGESGVSSTPAQPANVNQGDDFAFRFSIS